MRRALSALPEGGATRRALSALRIIIESLAGVGGEGVLGRDGRCAKNCKRREMRAAPATLLLEDRDDGVNEPERQSKLPSSL